MSLGNIKLYTYKNQDGEWQAENNPLNDYSTYEEWKNDNWDKGYNNEKSYSDKTFIKKPLLKSMTHFQSYNYWSATTYVNVTYYAWVVDFKNGDDGYGGKTNNKYFRCVRLNGQ